MVQSAVKLLPSWAIKMGVILIKWAWPKIFYTRLARISHKPTILEFLDPPLYLYTHMHASYRWGRQCCSLFWKLFSILFVILHWSELRLTNKAALCQSILDCANVLRCTRSTNHEVGERDLSLSRVKSSDQPLYENISLQPHLGTHERQCNVAFLGVGLYYYCHSQNAHKSKRKDTIGIQIHPEVLELQ